MVGLCAAKLISGLFVTCSCAVQFTVNDIIEDSPAAFSQIRVGDRLRMVSSAFDGGAAALESHLSAPSRQKERVCFLAIPASARNIVYKRQWSPSQTYLAQTGVAEVHLICSQS